MLTIFLVILLFCSLPNLLEAQDGQADVEAARKKYDFELKKNWSFGYENYKNKQFERAVKYFWEVAKLDTADKFPRVYRYLGQSYFKLQKVDSAQHVYEIGVQKTPDDVFLHRSLAFLYTQRGQIDTAIVEYEKVIELEPDAVDDWRQLANHYARVERIEDAIAAFEKVLELNPGDLEAQRVISELYSMMGDIESVIEKKEEVRAADAKNSQVRFELGKLYFDQAKYEKSIELFKEYLTISVNDVQANKVVYAEISQAYRELRQYSVARNFALKALNIDNAFGLGWLALGQSYESSAEKCGDQNNGKIGYDEKLVYELAYQKYRRASRDIAYQSEAARQISYLEPVLPTKEDLFMHSKQKKPVSGCYEWIAQAEFGDGYWKALNSRLGN
jgi:tetratricopeptide (TPR) repeat protein